MTQLLLKISILGLVREQNLFHPDHIGLNVSLNCMEKPDSVMYSSLDPFLPGDVAGHSQESSGSR